MIFDGAKRSGVEGSAVVLAFALAFAFAHLPQICHHEQSAAGAPSDRSSSLGWLSGAEGPAFVFAGPQRQSRNLNLGQNSDPGAPSLPKTPIEPDLESIHRPGAPS